MPWSQRIILLPAKRAGLTDITAEIEESLPELARINVGLLHVFLRHTSASLTITENADPDVVRDLECVLDKLAPEDFPYVHTCEGPDDMPAHVKNALLGRDVTVPVQNGKLMLGTWQGIFLCEHRTRASARQLVLTLQGE